MMLGLGKATIKHNVEPVLHSYTIPKYLIYHRIKQGLSAKLNTGRIWSPGVEGIYFISGNVFNLEVQDLHLALLYGYASVKCWSFLYNNLVPVPYT